SSRRRHTRSKRDWSSDVCSSDLDFLLYVLRMTRLFSVNRRERLNKPMRQLKKFLRIISNLRYIPRRQELFISTKAFVFWALTSGRITWCFQRRELDRKSTRMNSS